MRPKYQTLLWKLTGWRRKAKKPLKLRTEHKQEREKIKKASSVRRKKSYDGSPVKNVRITNKGQFKTEPSTINGVPVKVYIAPEKDESKASAYAEILDQYKNKKIGRKKAIDMLLNV